MFKSMRFFIKTLGCRTNISESESLLNALAEKGHSYSEHDPDLIVINSCTVTAKADRKTRQALTALQYKFPKAKCVVIGCGVRNTELTWPV
ncbi:MAG: hypothetical protein PHU71_00920, partial [Candidatus Gracilibacteria bacterium]|nr:hypothetical protein [Candidatus Gracilibacteria bacterium]